MKVETAYGVFSSKYFVVIIGKGMVQKEQNHLRARIRMNSEFIEMRENRLEKTLEGIQKVRLGIQGRLGLVYYGAPGREETVEHLQKALVDLNEKERKARWHGRCDLEMLASELLDDKKELEDLEEG